MLLAYTRRFIRLAVLTCCMVTAIAPLATAAPSKWMQLRSANFLLVGDAGERTLRDVGTRLEEFRETLVRTLPSAAIASPVPMVVLVFDSDRSFQPYKPLYRGKPIDLAGYFVMGEHAAYVALTLEHGGEMVYPIVFHEYAHFVVNNTVPAVPVWLNEGIAEYYSTFETRKDGRAAVIGRPVAQHVQALRSQPLLPIDELIQVDQTSPVYNEGTRRGMFYAESWAFVHYLSVGSQARQGQIDAYLARIREQSSPVESFRDAFKCEPAALEKELRDYVRRFMFNAVQWTFTESVASKVSAAAEPIAESEAQGWLGDFLAHTGRDDEAKERLSAAIQADSTAALARAMLGLLHLRNRKVDEALPLLERAATLAPDHPAVQSALGYGLVQRLEQEGAGAPDDEATITRARQALSRATTLAPESADSLIALAYVELVAGTDLAQAMSAAERAIKLAPARESYRLVLGQILIQQRKFDAARQVLGPLIARASQEHVKAEARDIMGRMSAFERQLRAQGEASASGSGAAPPPRDSSPATRPGRDEVSRSIIPALREVREGEDRYYGQLEFIECQKDGVIVLRIRIAERPGRYGAKGFDAVDFISYRNDVRGAVTCGAVDPPLKVMFTKKVTTSIQAGRYPFDGEAVAIEIVPDDFVPPPTMRR